MAHDTSQQVAKDQAEKQRSDEDEARAEAMDQGDQGGYADKTVNELKDELREKDLPVSGKKDELIERLEGGDQAQGSGSDDAQDQTDQTDQEDQDHDQKATKD